MLKVNFYDVHEVDDEKLKFAVIVSKYRGQWVFVRHKERDTWEIPGGHREENEEISFTAKRELQEETGALKFFIEYICVYSVQRVEEESFGGLFYAEISEIGSLPELEIGEVKLFEDIPEDLTYPLIQPSLFEKILENKK